MFGDEDGRVLRGTGAALERIEVGDREQSVDAELEERRRTRHRVDERFGIVAPDIGRVAARREVGDLELHLEPLFPLVAPLGGGLARRVRVVRQRHLAGEVLERQEVLVGERGAARRDRGGHAGQRERHHVGVALADHDLAARHDLTLRPVQAVEQARLLIDRVLG